MKVYIAGPYSKGDVAVNVRNAIKAGEDVVAEGHTPFVPHLTHLWHLMSPHKIEYWYELDNTWLLVCDCLIRLPGESSGADAEVALAIKFGKPVYYSVDEWICELE